MPHNHLKDLGHLNLTMLLEANLVTTVQDLLLNVRQKHINLVSALKHCLLCANGDATQGSKQFWELLLLETLT